ncbi:MAG: phenylalanine--tRNA ligase subunit alpha [Acidimicrobiia bacterium]
MSQPSFDQLEKIESDGAQRVGSAASLDELREAEAALTGREGALTALQKSLGQLPPEERKTRGQALNEARARLSAVAAQRRAVLEEQDYRRRLEADRLDLTEVIPGAPRRGHLHLVQQTRDELEDVFIGMGYSVSEGPEVDTGWNCFEALNIPADHPARSGFDTLYIDLGEPESVCMRPHTSPVQIRVMQAQAPPIYTVAPGRVYRRDTPDARHTPGFSQIEGLVVDKGITFGDLAGTIEAFTKAYFGSETTSRLRPAYFPFTEPSAEFEVTCPICVGDGCRTCSNTGWIELGGCGMVHPNVFRAVGIDPEEWTGFAFGFGIDRLAQVRHTISDMRILLDNDLRFTRQF